MSNNNSNSNNNNGILVINAAGRETRVALVENGNIAEFYLERKKDRGIVGNIYKGRVTRVLPGMQAAFLDIGEDKAAFLYVGDVLFDPDVTKHQFDMTEGETDEDVREVPEESAADSAPEPQAEIGEPEATPEGGETESIGDSAPTPIPLVQVAHAGEPGVASEALVAPAVDGAVQPSSDSSAPATVQEVIAAATEEMAARPTGSEVVAAPVTADAPAVSSSIEAPRSQAPRDVRGNERGHNRPKHNKPRKPEFVRKQSRIEDLLKVGQEVLVQVSKDPIGTKGARITCHISIPGRHLVFMPTVDHVGISRRIGNEKERRRLRETVDRMRPPGTGFIVRTVAETVPQEKLEADIRFLIEVWNETVRKNEKNHKPGLLHPDLDMILRATRDLFAQDVEKLVIDEREEFIRVQNFVTAQDPSLKDRIVLHEGEEPIFDAYGIEEEIKRATARKVWLKSGGYIIIDQAEALTAIDVNSGKYVGKKNLEDTILKINTEAAREIVYQLRLRNIGGIIICDFIDMEKQQNRDRVFKTLQEAMGRDKAKTNVLRISELGLVEMTRKRVRESIGRVLHEDCGYCNGQGSIKTATTVAYEIFRELRRSAGNYKDPTLVVQCHAEVANIVQVQEREELRHLMDRFNKSIQVKGHAEFHREQYDIYSRPMSGIEIRVASNSVEFDANAYPGARKPGSQEAKGGGERAQAGADRNERNDRGDRNEKSERTERNDKNDRNQGGKRGRDRQQGGRGGGREGGRDNRPNKPQGQQQQAQGGQTPAAKPSAPIVPYVPPSSGSSEGGSGGGTES
jgi:Rne/Rng family ribonuclease